jgi:DNA-binding response OmpR family regulator
MKKARIVVIDDNAEITRLLRNVLVQEGYAVAVANEAMAGQSLVDQEHPDLAIVDVRMPVLDGWELCRRIRQKHQIPILMLTVLAEAGDVEQGLRAGADAYLTKPFTIAGLLERVRGLLQKRLQRVEPGVIHLNDSRSR